MRRLPGFAIEMLATGFGVGWMPVAPGTLATALGVAFAWALTGLPGGIWTYATATALLCLAGVPICGHAARRLGQDDPTSIVYDEIASVPIVFLGLAPWGHPRATLLILTGFVAHRLFDTLKPPPIRWLERLPGGWGIMADDWLAAAYAHIVLRIVVAMLGS